MEPVMSITMNKTNPKVDGYLRKSKQWQIELQKLRSIILDCGLTEEVKWRVPCYTFQGHNVLFIGRFNEYCVLSFIKGVLLKDTRGILIQQTENSQSVRIIRFNDVQQIAALEPALKSYIRQAIDLEKSGAKVPLKKITEHKIPEELEIKLNKLPALKTAFKALTPGRQRAYFLYISSAKQSKTREARVEKCTPRILGGKGLDD
jgi:uncharacterized protein YdeI (YjbR/CyaY-like superfamily)